MDHNDIRHKLSEYLDGSVTPEEQSAIEAHLAACAECSGAMTELRKTIEAMKQVEEVEAPAWMTSKIMAKVREGQKAKTSFWHRLFYPLAVKIPIQTVAVLFLTITAYYIYTSTNPAEKYGDAQLSQVAKEEARPAPGMIERKEPELSASPEKKAKQEPGYRSLDMKYSYEKPAAPAPVQTPAAAPAEAPAPSAGALAKRTAPMMMKDEAAPESKAAAPEEAAPARAVAPKTACLSYEPEQVTIAGTMTKADYPGPPNYSSIDTGDRKETLWILRLDSPVCVSKSGRDDSNVAVSGITEMQLVLSAAQFDAYRSLVSKPVIIKGALFHGHTGHHRTPVLMTVQSIELTTK